MQYQLYIYNLKSRFGDQSFSAAVFSPSLRERLDETDYYDFDVQAIKTEIEKQIGEKCRVTICFPVPDCKAIRALYVTTTYDDIQDVILCLHTITERNRLTLYDAERKKTFSNTLIDDSFLYNKQRIKHFKDAILREVSPIWSIHRLYSYRSDAFASEYAYVVTLKKIKGVSFLDRTADFYHCLQRHLSAGERLTCDDHCFRIQLKAGEVTFCLEGYKKEPNLCGYVENEQPKTMLLHRMGCEKKRFSF